jgi:hypothetical protein
MSHAGNQYAVSPRDNIVGKAMKSDKASINYQEGKNYPFKIAVANRQVEQLCLS